MRRAKLIILLLLISTALISCTNDTHMNSSYDQSDSSANTTGVVTSEDEEVSNMRMEICQLESIQEDSFTLRNTKDEIYRIDISFLGELKEGDSVYLTYLKRTPLSDGEYTADVYMIELDTFRLEDARPEI